MIEQPKETLDISDGSAQVTDLTHFMVISYE